LIASVWCLVAIYFVSKLARAFLSPKECRPGGWSTSPTTGRERSIMQWSWPLVVVNGMTYVLTTVSQTLDSPVVLTVAKGLLSVVLMALILMAMSMGKPMLAASGDPADQRTALAAGHIRNPLLAGVGLLATALLGYIGLARFVATQIVVTGAILTTMYIGYLSGKAISERMRLSPIPRSGAGSARV
jgi:potassium efflux system protein